MAGGAVEEVLWTYSEVLNHQPPDRRASDPRGSPQPLHRPRHTQDGSRCMKLIGTRESSPSNQFPHVWMPPGAQVGLERLGRVIGCGHVSGLFVRRLTQPLAGMAMRGSEADQQSELGGSCAQTALSSPDLYDPLSLRLRDLLTLLADRDERTDVSRLRRRRHRVPVILMPRQHGPKSAGHFVGQGDGGHHAGLAH